jgi:hypothetical protein
MFFRRARAKELTFEERLERIRKAGFKADAQPGSHRVQVIRDGYATTLQFADGIPHVLEGPGILMDGEIGVLTDGGFQKFFLTPSGRRKPALAPELRTLHDSQEDLNEAVGEISLYNEALGTVSTLYLYDRVKDRDRGVPKRAWE